MKTKGRILITKWALALTVVLALISQRGIIGAASPYDEQLIEAAKNGDAAQVSDLLKKGADVNAKGKSDWTALMFATSRGHAEVVRLLLDKGA